jgi:YVTN family beta-propeller protein
MWSIRCLPLLMLVLLWSVSAAAQCYVYVPTNKSNSVAVINTATNIVSTVIRVGIQPFSVAITPDGAFAYVTNSG